MESKKGAYHCAALIEKDGMTGKDGIMERWKDGVHCGEMQEKAKLRGSHTVGQSETRLKSSVE